MDIVVAGTGNLFPPLTMLLVMYGLAFGLQNKVAFLRGKLDVLDSLLDCTYCLGTHTGWISWFIYAGLVAQFPADTWYQNIVSVLVWAMCGAAFSYIADALVRYWESNT